MSEIGACLARAWGWGMECRFETPAWRDEEFFFNQSVLYARDRPALSSRANLQTCQRGFSVARTTPLTYNICRFYF